MQLNRASYDGMNWADALSKRLQGPKDMEAHLAQRAEEADSAEDSESALQETARILFDLPTDQEPQRDAIRRASRAAMDESAQKEVTEQIQSIRQKLAVHGIDPVALGVVSEKEWQEAGDPKTVEAVAKQAALKAEAEARRSWEARAIEEMNSPRTGFGGYDPEFSKDGVVAPTTSRHDDSVAHNPSIASNLNSLLDPERLKRLAEGKNDHDESVASARKRAEEAKKASSDWRTEEVPEDLMPMNGASVLRAGGRDADIGRYKAPSNQVSMLDDISGKDESEVANKLAELFASKIQDSGADIRQANEQRKAEIQREAKQDDREWDKPTKAKSTSDIAQRLAELWLPTGKDK